MIMTGEMADMSPNDINTLLEDAGLNVEISAITTDEGKIDADALEQIVNTERNKITERIQELEQEQAQLEEASKHARTLAKEARAENSENVKEFITDYKRARKEELNFARNGLIELEALKIIQENWLP